MAEAAAATVAWLTSTTGLTIQLTAVEAYVIATAVELVAVSAASGLTVRRSVGLSLGLNFEQRAGDGVDQ